MIALLWLGCAAPPGDSAVGGDSSAEPVREMVSEDGCLEVRYTPEPDPISLNQSFALRVEVVELEDCGLELAAASVSVDAWMPEHGHGMTVTPEVAAAGEGSWLAQPLLLHMPGYWEILIGVAGKGWEEQLTFPLTLEP